MAGDEQIEPSVAVDVRRVDCGEAGLDGERRRQQAVGVREAAPTVAEHGLARMDAAGAAFGQQRRRFDETAVGLEPVEREMREGGGARGAAGRVVAQAGAEDLDAAVAVELLSFP
jgi:hypothetical protein